MEKELESQVKSVEKRFKPLERTDEPDLKDEDVKEILHDVLTELYYSKGQESDTRIIGYHWYAFGRRTCAHLGRASGDAPT